MTRTRARAASRTRPALALLAAAGVGGCLTLGRGPELALIYTPSASHHAPDRNPIVVIPGILGTRLVERGSERLVWGAFDGSAADPGRAEEARLIALPIRRDEPIAAMRDEVEPAGVLDRVRIRLLRIPLELQAYAQILSTLGAGGYRDQALGLGGEVDYGDDHFTCFQFDYDWRRDNVENAHRLAEFLREKRAFVQEEYRKRFGIEDPTVKFDIAAHSMGGLVVRWFLRHGAAPLPADGSPPPITWAGAEYLERVILIGTPNAGSAQALIQLVEGRRFGPLLPYYPPALLGTFPSTYQLLPRSRHRPLLWDGDPERPVGDVYDPALWERLGWGLAAPDQAPVLATLVPRVDDPAERRALALDLQRRALDRARAFTRALDRPARPPAGVEIFLVAGDATPTELRLGVDSRSGALHVVERAPGDGTVLRSSALLDERVGQTWRPRLRTPIDFRRVLFLPDDHLGLTRSSAFRDNVLYWLLEEPRAGDFEPAAPGV